MLYIKLEDLKPHPKNDYYFDEDREELNFELLKNSIIDNLDKGGKGLYDNVIITRDNVIVSGHRRYRAFQELSKTDDRCKKIPCEYIKCGKDKLTDDDIEMILIAANLTSRDASSIKNKLKLGRCIDKICEYNGIKKGNNQYSSKRNNFASEISADNPLSSLNSKKKLAEYFGVTPRQIENFQKLANASEALQNAYEEKAIKSTEAYKVAALPEDEQIEYIENISKTSEPETKPEKEEQPKARTFRRAEPKISITYENLVSMLKDKDEDDCFDEGYFKKTYDKVIENLRTSELSKNDMGYEEIERGLKIITEEGIDLNLFDELEDEICAYQARYQEIAEDLEWLHNSITDLQEYTEDIK